MKRRSKVSGERPKRSFSNASKIKHRAAPEGVTRRASSAVGERGKIAQLTRELNEAQEQRRAASKVLEVISRSAGDLQPVFAAILENATSICRAAFANLLLYDGSDFRVAAMHNASLEEYMQHRYLGSILNVSLNNPLRRLVSNKQVQHIADIRKEEAYVAGEPAFTQLVNRDGARTLLNVPLINELELIGVIGIYRQEICPFTDEQIELVQTFAAQAVIAIENSRLRNELRQSLEQQTAASELLGVISSLDRELDPVFKAMLASATRLCEASFGLLHLHEDGMFPVVATYNAPPAYVELRRRQPIVRPETGHPLGRVAATRQVLHILDIRTEVGYREREAAHIAFADLAGGRTLLVVPMLKNNELVGTIVIFRLEVRPFTDKQIELVKNFAAQTVIAIENARLSKELRESSAEVKKTQPATRTTRQSVPGS